MTQNTSAENAIKPELYQRSADYDPKKISVSKCILMDKSIKRMHCPSWKMKLSMKGNIPPH